MSDTIEIDGSMGEGGGQVIRTSLALSIITGRPVRISNVRHNRKPPGLKAQHLAGLRAAAAICGAEVSGDRKGSETIEFAPGPVAPGDYRFDIGTAGATSLVLHTVVYPLASADAPSTVTVTGGTHVPWSPAGPYLERVWAWWYARCGGQLDLEIERAGFYPKGGGILRATIGPAGEPHLPKAIKRGELEAVELHSHAAASLADHIVVRQLRGAKKPLRAHSPLEEHPEQVDSIGNGTALVAVARFAGSRSGATAIGKIGKRAEDVGKEAGKELAGILAAETDVDEHTADQLLLPLALAPGSRSVSFTTDVVSQHLLTNKQVIDAFLADRARITIEGDHGQPGRVTVAT